MKIFQVDAFTDTPFKGNPAAVNLLDNERPDFQLLSETDARAIIISAVSSSKDYRQVRHFVFGKEAGIYGFNIRSKLSANTPTCNKDFIYRIGE